jgi:type II secretory pathway pseudopilin PulG
LRRLAASEGGFGLVELLIAMTVMVIAIMAIVAAFSSGMVTLRRAADASTAAAVADKQMEAYRALPNCAIYLDSTTFASAGAAYTADTAYSATQLTTNTPLIGSSTCTVTPPASQKTAHQSLTGSDGRAYVVDTYIVAASAVTGALSKKVTLVVRDPHDATNTKALVRESSTFTPPTGCNNPPGQQSIGC